MALSKKDLEGLFDDCSLSLEVNSEELSVSFNFDLFTSSEFLIENLAMPEPNASLRMISPRQGWSSCSLILAISELEKIEELYITTLCIGKKELIVLAGLDVDTVFLTLGTITQKYANEIKEIAEENQWSVKYTKNHSKVILIKTKDNFYTVETSSNLNENPQIEQFCITNSKSVFDFYMQQMKKLDVWEV